MKRLFPTTLALLLVTASFGHVFAAAFCPRTLGRECCIAKTTHHAHGPSSSDVHKANMHMDGMSMDGMNMGDMTMGDTSMDHNAMDDVVRDASTADISIPAWLGPGEEPAANRFQQTVESCPHCLGHSGIVNAPISSVGAPGHSNKDLAAIPVAPAKFCARSAMRLAQIGLSREHAPPGSTAPRHVLLNVFLI